MAKFKQTTVAVDFDGVIADDTGVEFPQIGSPKPGAVEGLRQLHNLGCRIRIYTCRLNRHSLIEGTFQDQYEKIVAYLLENGIPYDDIVVFDEGKPFADIYLDDRAVNFVNWEQAVQETIEALDVKIASEVCRVIRIISSLGSI